MHQSVLCGYNSSVSGRCDTVHERVHHRGVILFPSAEHGAFPSLCLQLQVIWQSMREKTHKHNHLQGQQKKNCVMEGSPQDQQLLASQYLCFGGPQQHDVD